MTCVEARRDAAGFADGSLGPDERRTVEQHLATCGECSAVIADLRAVQAAASTLDRMEPPALLWERVRAGVAGERPTPRRRVIRWPGTRQEWGVWTAAAAALLIAAGASLYPLVRSSGPAPSSLDAGQVADIEVLASVQFELQAAEAHYDKAILGLEQITRSESGALDPQVAAVLQKNLQVIDQAIGESRAALQTQPASASAQGSLFDALRSKVALLQQTVELINEMRKGNQAEAGRLVQGLNQ
ncbi:MAG: anti-sigma factor family protein [Acidobacteriota bacterium]